MITEMAAFSGRLFDDLLKVEYIGWIVAKRTDMPFILNFLKPVDLKFSLKLFGYSSKLKGAV